MKKKLLISFLGSIALIIGLCCFSSSALSEDDTKVMNYWFSQNGLSRIDSSVTAPYSEFFCLRMSDGYYIYLSNNQFYFFTGRYPLDSYSSLYLYMNGPYTCYRYKDINDTWNYYDSSYNYIYHTSFNVWQSFLSNPYLSSMNIDVVGNSSNNISNGIDFVYQSNYIQDNFTPLKDWYIANTPLENPFEDNNGLFFNTVSDTMSTAYNSAIQPLLTELSSIGLIPFLLFFLAMSIVVVWFFGVVF